MSVNYVIPNLLNNGIKEGEARYGKQAHWCGIGDGEICVTGKVAVYAAPTLIYHYVVEHQYRPPDEFINTVLSGTQPGTEEHKNLLSQYS